MISVSRRIALAAGCVLMFVGTGCWSTKPGPEAEVLSPDVIPEDMPLHPRENAYGRPVPRSEFSADPVYFAYDSYQVANSELTKMQAVAAFMRRNPGVLLVIEGHCDERGTREYNMSLGEHRALAVRAGLVQMRIPSSRIQTRSFGEEMPADPGHSDQAWRRNRRGVFALYRKR